MRPVHSAAPFHAVVSIFVDPVGSACPQEKILCTPVRHLDCDSAQERRFIADSFYIETVPVNCVSMATPSTFIRAVDDQG
jgi:hypothetical protein